ncbi:uncharacterized protein LOC128249906 [Argonauta hians]
MNLTNVSTTVSEASNDYHSVQGALSQQQHRTQSFTAVLVLTGLFALFTISITGAIIVFCKKKNTVFALQKCEQDSDIDCELDDINTELEMSDDSADDYLVPMSKKSATYPNLEIVCNRNYRPHDLSGSDGGSIESTARHKDKEKHNVTKKISRAHTFSFESYEYRPIKVNAATANNNKDNKRAKKGSEKEVIVIENNHKIKAVYHQVKTSSKEALSPEDGSKSFARSVKESRDQTTPTENGAGMEDDFILDKTMLLQQRL